MTGGKSEHRITWTTSDRKTGKEWREWDYKARRAARHLNSEQGTSNVSVISTQRATEGKNEWEGKEKMADANHGDPARWGRQLTACESRWGFSPSTWQPDVPLNQPAETSGAYTSISVPPNTSPTSINSNVKLGLVPFLNDDPSLLD